MTHDTTLELNYQGRPLKQWLNMADNGEIALPNFQRSFVWDNNPEKAARYLESMLHGHPTGVYLTLQANQSRLQFKSRNFVGIDIANSESVTEMVLDGQQRLTSLWQILRSDSPPPYFIRVNSFEGPEITVNEVFHCSESTAKIRRLFEPAQAYKACCIPVSVLNRPKILPSDGNTLLWKWCRDAIGGDPDRVQALYTFIGNSLQSDLMDARLWYCQLPNTMDSSDIINIFIETNRSPVTVRTFDIVVAMTQSKYEIDLRDRASSFYKKKSLVSAYLSNDKQKWIPDLGEWLLKIGCLKIRLSDTPDEVPKEGLPPTESNYTHVLTHAFKGSKSTGLRHLDELEKDLVHSIKIVEPCGGFTWRTLPGSPEMYVIGALREPFERIENPSHRSLARKLLSSYLWRAFFSTRYHAQANTKLHEDYRELNLCLEEIAEEGRLTSSNRPLIFNENEYKLPDYDHFMDTTGVNHIRWIGNTKSRLSCAVVALSLRQEDGPALDWVEGDILDAATIRDLERTRKIDRHHIFPKRFLSKLLVPEEEIDSPLNGVILRKRSNLGLGSKDPRDYLARVMEEANIEEEELRKRIESHLVPYAPLRSNASPESRYQTFRKERAKLLANKLKKLAAFPGNN